MNEKIIVVAIIAAICVVSIAFITFGNFNTNKNPDLQVTLKSCEYNSYNEEYDLHLFTAIFHVKPIGFTDRHQFHINYANITDGNERDYGQFHPIRNNTAEDYTYWLGFSLREIIDPIELSITFSIKETDLTGSTRLAVPIFSKTLRLYPKIIPTEEIDDETENIANFEVQFLYNASISDYDRVKLTFSSENSGNGSFEIYFSTYENLTAGEGGSVEASTFNGIYVEKGENTLILPHQNLCKKFSEYENGYVIIRHVKESLEIETLASGLMPQIAYEDIPNT